MSVWSVEICYTLAVSRDTICSKCVSFVLSFTSQPDMPCIIPTEQLCCALGGVMCPGAKSFTCKCSSCLLRPVGWNRIQYYTEPTMSRTTSFFPPEQARSKNQAQDSQSFRLV